MSMKIYAEGKMVGNLVGEVFTAKKKSWRHYLVVREGYAISESALDTLVRYGCKTVVIEETRPDKSKHRYQCPLKMYVDGEVFHDPPHDRQRSVKLRRLTYLGRIDDKGNLVDDDGDTYQTRLG